MRRGAVRNNMAQKEQKTEICSSGLLEHIMVGLVKRHSMY